MSSKIVRFALLVLCGTFCAAQTPSDLAALKGLAPVTVLSRTSSGNAALGANFTITGGIQLGSVRQPTLFPFDEQQQQALRDIAITWRNLAQLSDGLGTSLGSAYLARAHYIDTDHFTNMTQSVAEVIAYAIQLSAANANSGKFFFANLTTDGQTPVSAEAKQVLVEIGGQVDPFGKAYKLPAGSPNGDKFGNSRPFQTEPRIERITGKDYFNSPADNWVYNHGPLMDLTDSPSYPSGHTTYGYTGALLLALLVPQRYSEMMVRGAEYGNDRIIVGAHYAMDVLGGRTLALYDMAHLLAGDPNYIDQTFTGVEKIKDFRGSVLKARSDLAKLLEAACGKPVTTCATEDTSRFNDVAANKAFYSVTQTYNLPVVHPETAGKAEDIEKVAPEAGYLLTIAFPALTLKEADRILTETEGPGGGFLDDGSAFGVYSRLNLYEASQYAAKNAEKVAAGTHP